MGLIPGLGRFPWRRESQPTPVFLPGKFHGQGAWWVRWSCKESDTTEWLSMAHAHTHTDTKRKSQNDSFSCSKCQAYEANSWAQACNLSTAQKLQMVREMTERSESPCSILLSLHVDSASWKQGGWRWQGDDSADDLWSDHALVTVKLEKTWLPKQQILCHSENLLCVPIRRELSGGERINGWTQFITLGKMCDPEYPQVAIIFFSYSLLENL